MISSAAKLARSAGQDSPASQPIPARMNWSQRLPLGVKVLIPIFALVVVTALAAAAFFSYQSVVADREVQAREGRTIATLVKAGLESVPANSWSVDLFLRHVAAAYTNVSAVCVFTANPNDRLGPLVVYSSSGPSTACDQGSPLMPRLGMAGVVTGIRQTAAGDFVETAAPASLSGFGEGAVVQVQVRVTPYPALAVPTFKNAAVAGLLLGLVQTGVVFFVLWASALRPLKRLRLKALAAAKAARKSGSDDGGEPVRSNDEIHDLSLRFEEMLGAVRAREVELVASHEKLETLIGNSPVTVFSIDTDGRLTQIQGRAIGPMTKDLGRSSMEGMSVLQLVQPNLELAALVQRALAGEIVHEVVPVRPWAVKGIGPESVHLDLLLTPTRDGRGNLTGATGLTVNVSDRMDAAAARAESMQKSAFLAAMSHELRTPLNSIMGFSQLLEIGASKAGLSNQQRRYVGHIYSSGEHLLALISDIIDLAKVGAGQMEVNLETVAVESAVKDPVEKMRPLALEKGLSIEMEIPAGLAAFTDRQRVRQILLNLLANAVKFSTEESGAIRVTGRASGDGIEIAITDSGIGIAPQEQERIFEEFTQVDSGRSRRQDGSGLGLALTKKMVEIVGGRIRVESELGHGSTFTVWLPGAATA